MNSGNGRTLWLFTRQYPKGRGEAFLESAIPVWGSCFERVVIIPMFDGVGEVALPPGVEVRYLWKDAFASATLSRTLGELSSIARVLWSRNDGKPPTIHELPEALSHARQLLRKVDECERALLPDLVPDRTVLLSTWMEDWVNVLGLLRQRHPELRFTTMAHGWDLYEHRRKDGRIPYRRWQMDMVDQVLCISDPGAAYLHERFPVRSEKVRLTHLGTKDHGAGPWEPGPVLRLVSCAYLRSPKRLDRLADALHRIDRPVEWIHFGDGPDLPALRERVATLPAGVKVDLRGAVPNATVLEHYRTRPVDLFVLISDDEGVPVSLMEAASFGIPLMANDVGGVRAVVNPATGVLLPAQVTSEGIARAIEHAAQGPLARQDFRQGVRACWKEHFEADRNYAHIADILR